MNNDTFAKRICAYIIDNFLFSLLSVFIFPIFVFRLLQQFESGYFIFSVLSPFHTLFEMQDLYSSKSIYFNDYCILVVSAVLIETILNFVIILIKHDTIGHLIMKLKIINKNGGNIKWYNLLLRCLIKTVSKYWFFIPFATAIFSSNKFALHDIITKTKVVAKPKI
ncbi:hypothetical protein FACS1894132_13210 [Clostridia bacterium]|nr:hypothetical protein FACS1894132_13210 [Clostridia bacterium]